MNSSQPNKKAGDIVYFGRTNFRNRDQLFGIKRKDRRQHTYVIGKTGTGKSALLHNFIIQDISNGEGVCVVDPHGELVESIVEKIPEERINDVIYINPADSEHNVGFNVLEIPDPKYKHLVASGLMAIFTKIWANVWSARMEYILSNAVLALLDTPGSTLLGINRLLVDKDFRMKIIANVKDPVVKAFWISEYEEWRDQFRNEAIAPIQNKVGQFLSTPLIRNIVGQSKSTIDIYKSMNEGKILLINVSKGKIGEDNSSLLGAMLITKVQLAAMERVRIPEEERVDFYLYVDEFQNFATDSFANILSEARKYRLNLIIAHQYIGQLVTDVSTKVRDAVFGNVGTMLVFRIGATDAEFLEKEFDPEFTIQDMVNIPNYHIYLKLMVDGITSRPFSAATLPPFKIASSTESRQKAILASQKKYARPRETVENEIDKSSDAVSKTAVNAVCAACGDSTVLNFQPREGRAIYCENCLKKIKDGKMKPLLDEKDFTSKTRPEYFSDLRALGIDIGESNRDHKNRRNDNSRGSQSGRHEHHRENQNRPRPENQNYQENKKPQSVIEQVEKKFHNPNSQKQETEISLSALKTIEEKSANKHLEPKKEEDITNLRASLRAALNNKKPNTQ